MTPTIGTPTIGTAKAAAGRIRYGTYPLVDHPVGGSDAMPVILAQGDPSGPVFWVLAGIHGPEHAGLQVIHHLITRELVKQLHGTLVAIPALNPAGLRTMQRQAYYHNGDPNRLWPDGKPARDPDPDEDPPSGLERAYGRLFDDMRGAAAVVDLHNAWTGSVSFAFRDRVFYRNDGPPAQRKLARAAAQKVDAQLAEMCAAYGHPIVQELPVKKYLARQLHRSTTAAVTNLLRIPALTMELGTGHMPDPDIVRAAVAGVRNLLRWAGMLPGEREPITGIKLPDPGFACRRCGTPRVSVPCVVHHLCEPGELVAKGQPVAEVRDIWGRPIGEKVLTSEFDGWVMARSHGVLYYPGAEVYGMAIRDELPTVQPYPRDYFKT
jgi:predicted deacylase